MYQNFNVLRRLILLVAFLKVILVHSQSLPLVDSLKNAIPSATGKNKFDLVYKVAYELFDVNNQEAVSYADSAYSLALKLGDSLEITKSGRIHGQLLRRVDRLDDAIEQLSEVLPIAQRNHFVNEEKFILNALALTYMHKANFDKALQYNFRSLEIREIEGNKKEISVALNNIGLVYYKIGDYDKALEFYDRSLKAKEEDNVTSGLDQLLINIALCYDQIRNYEKAEEFIYRGFKVCGDDCSDQIKLEGEFGLGVSFYERVKYDEAKVHLNKAYEIAKKNEDKRFQAESLLLLSTIYRKEGDVKLSLSLLSEVENLAKNSGYNQILINAYLEFSKLYNQNKDFEKAAFYQSKYIQLKDSVYSEELIKNIARVQTDYEQRENIKTIKEKDDVLRLKEEIIKKQRSQYFFILTITILSIILAFVFIRFNRAQHQTNVELATAKREIEDKNKALESSNAILDARVKDRTIELEESNRSIQMANDELDNFIYKTSHDIRGPLASLKGMTNVAMMDVKDEVALEYFRKLDVSAEKLNIILTRLVIVNHINHTKLAPELIDFRGMIDDILLLERKKGIPPQMKISYEVGPEVALQSDKVVLRIAMENLIGNAIKFYSDSQRIDPFVKISVRYGPGEKVEIIILDNGIGIHDGDQKKLFHMFTRASERSDTGGIGLYLAKLSTEKLRGNILYTATPEKYTQFIIELPADLGKILDKKRQEESKNTFRKDKSGENLT